MSDFSEWLIRGDKGRNTLVLCVLARIARKKGKNALDFWEMAQMGRKRGENGLDFWEMAQMGRKKGENALDLHGLSESGQKNGINPVEMARSSSNCFSKTLVTFVRCDITIRRLYYRLCDVHRYCICN
jgi:hypothetical protein